MNRLAHGGLFCGAILFIVVALFSFFPLTDTDIWWHLACAREWVSTWTAVRTPVVNVHELFQKSVAFVYEWGGAGLLVIFKSLLWGIVFLLFMRAGSKKRDIPWIRLAVTCALLFLFRYQFEIRPVIFSLLFLGIYWNVLPYIFQRKKGIAAKQIALCLVLLLIQWGWCKCQGLFIFGPLFASAAFVVTVLKAKNSGENIKNLLPRGLLPLAMFAMPFLHREGLSLFLYPYGLLDRLLGLSQSASVFASEIAENRSPVTLLLAGENTLVSFGMVFLAIVSIGHELLRILILRKEFLQDDACGILRHIMLLVTAILSLVAERNFVLFLPVFTALWLGPWRILRLGCKTIPSVSVGVPSAAADTLETVSEHRVITTSVPESGRPAFRILFFVFIAFLLGLWIRSLLAYDRSMVAYQRVPVTAAEWMKVHPHCGRLFNDDRAGGYLAFVNPKDSTYIDGRFILKTAEFFERYLLFSREPDSFMEYAVENQIDRVILPIRYYARWESLVAVLLGNGIAGEMDLETVKSPDKTSYVWRLVYHDEFYVVIDRPLGSGCSGKSLDDPPSKRDNRRPLTPDPDMPGY